jgi:hypothetical protein
MPSCPTDATYASIVSAITAIEADPYSPRTKAHLMRLAGIAHPTVHRAFKWDKENGTPFRISERWDSLTGDTTTRRSPAQMANADRDAKLKDARQEIAALREQLDATRDLAAAAWIRFQTGDSAPSPIRSPRKPNARS